MKNIIKSAFLIQILLLCFSCKQKEESVEKFQNIDVHLAKDEEPPLLFEVKTTDTTQVFVENLTKKWEGTITNSDVTISVYPWKLFPHNNIEFEYPRTFSFEADLSDTSDMWILSGNDFKIMVFQSNEEIAMTEYVEKMTAKFGSANSNTSFISRTLGNVQYKGTKISVTLAGASLEMSVFQITAKNGKKFLLIFQDSLINDNANSKESKKVLERFESTFKLN